MAKPTLTENTRSALREAINLLETATYDFERDLPKTLRGLDAAFCERKTCPYTGRYYRVTMSDGRVFRGDTLREVRAAILAA